MSTDGIGTGLEEAMPEIQTALASEDEALMRHALARVARVAEVGVVRGLLEALEEVAERDVWRGHHWRRWWPAYGLVLAAWVTISIVGMVACWRWLWGR